MGLLATRVVGCGRRQGVQRIPALDYQKSSEASRRSIYTLLLRLDGISSRVDVGVGVGESMAIRR